MGKNPAENGGQAPGLSEQQELEQVTAGYQFAAAELARLERLMAAMASDDLSNEDLLDACPELKESYARNEKLKYRKGILEKSISAQEEANKKSGKSNGAPAEKKAKKGEKADDKKSEQKT